MKTLLIILTLVPSYIKGQQEIIESIKLDSLIFEKINDYRNSKGVDSFVAFEDSLMREFSYSLTRENSKKAMIEHSKDDKFEYYNAECIYSYRIYNSSVDKIDYYKNIDLNHWADAAVDGWINSPSHEHAISHHFYKVATITSRITFNRSKSEVFFVASFHALINDGSTLKNYVYYK